jgi:DNA repair photolyase
MSSQLSFNWGITEDLEAQVRYEPNACKGYVIDVSLGCPHHCVYCLFSPLELLVYKLKNPSYKGAVLPLKLDKFLTTESFPPAVYMCYSSDPLGNSEVAKNTYEILKKFMKHSVHVFFISKGIFPVEILELISSHPHLMHIQVGISNFNDSRNRIIEPGAPTYEQRIQNLKKLGEIKGIANLAVRIDPLFPVIDDTEENIRTIIKTVAEIGVPEAVLGYLIVTKDMRVKLCRNEFTRDAANCLTEKTNTISKQELYSIPFGKKVEKLYRFNEICKENHVYMAVCGCKDEKLKESDLEWICHPFNRSKRTELFNKDQNTREYAVDVSHLK